jgi:hypothetical protein
MSPLLSAQAGVKARGPHGVLHLDGPGTTRVVLGGATVFGPECGASALSVRPLRELGQFLLLLA